jgi:hypothetical protein
MTTGYSCSSNGAEGRGLKPNKQAKERKTNFFKSMGTL